MRQIVTYLQKLNLNAINICNNIEGAEYSAGSCIIHNKKVLLRSSKITPKKIGQFVTFWKRNTLGVTQPFSEKDSFDFLLIYVSIKENNGIFIFPKNILIAQGILHSSKSPGKRGFRIYHPEDTPTAKQAVQSQLWQIKHFYQIQDKEKVLKIFS